MLVSALASGSASARCSWENNEDPGSPCYTGNGSGVPDGFRDVQRIVIDGNRNRDSEWYWHLEQLGLLQATRVSVEISVSVKDAVDMAATVYPLQQKCAVATNDNPIKSPDEDQAANIGRGGAYPLARSAMLTAFSGNFGSLMRGQRVDVSYPSGHIVRFVILEVMPASPESGGNDLKIRRFISGATSGEKSPCV
jgi:hypothetical protein